MNGNDILRWERPSIQPPVLGALVGGPHHLPLERARCARARRARPRLLVG